MNKTHWFFFFFSKEGSGERSLPVLFRNKRRMIVLTASTGRRTARPSVTQQFPGAHSSNRGTSHDGLVDVPSGANWKTTGRTGREYVSSSHNLTQNVIKVEGGGTLKVEGLYLYSKLYRNNNHSYIDSHSVVRYPK